MSVGRWSRRDFLGAAGALAAGSGLSLSLAGCREAADSAAEAMRTGGGPRVLTDSERTTLEAFSDQIIPPDGGAPGAAALGAVVFMDHYLERHPDQLESARGAVDTIGTRLSAVYPAGTTLADLDPAAAETFMAGLVEEAPEAFWPLQALVVFGAFAAPAHGGNRDRAGWALLGYEDRHAWQPPFGYYDAQVGGEEVP